MSGAETGAMCIQVKECKGLQVAPEAKGKTRTAFILEASGHGSRFLASNSETMTFYCFVPPRLGYFVIAAFG